ncbi:hypothetical protein SAMN05444695_106171 [Rhodococcus triatomae]|uniref:Uncharacterized protein n=1 Tax=Rhodococcus triatomae TaxID=300028 RepID=A0A1G8JFV1_9NOCA|nr:hypothetical protein SAMN05444695_106171 [Rhodococcus triatomae]
MWAADERVSPELSDRADTLVEERWPEARQVVVDSSTWDADWQFYAVVETTARGGHLLATFGPRPSALDALELAVRSVNHTAYSLLEQGIAGSPVQDPRLVEQCPITSFTIRRRSTSTSELDQRWMLTGGKRPGRGRR